MKEKQNHFSFLFCFENAAFKKYWGTPPFDGGNRRILLSDHFNINYLYRVISSDKILHCIARRQWFIFNKLCYTFF